MNRPRAPRRTKKNKRRKDKKERRPTVQESARDEGSEAGDYSDVECESASDYRPGGYHPVLLGEKYKDRYIVCSKLGWGHFSTVWLCWDVHNECFVAMKIQKSAKHYTEAALDEINILWQLAEGDTKGMKHVLHIMDNFEIVGTNGKHVCMIFPVMGINLLDAIRLFSYRGLPIPVVKTVVRQLLIGLDYIHHNHSIIHTDLKPENVLLETPCAKIQKQMLKFQTDGLPTARSIFDEMEKEGMLNDVDVMTLTKSQKKRMKKKYKKSQVKQRHPSERNVDNKLEESSEEYNESDKNCLLNTKSLSVSIVDFGNSCWTYHQFTDDIQTRQYRSPEVILGLPYNTSTDIWSLGCLIFELLTGDTLFNPRAGDDYSRDDDHLALMLELLGSIPSHMCSGKASRFFTGKGELRRIKELNVWPLKNVLIEKYHMEETEATLVSELITKMLEFDPTERPPAHDYICHPWLAKEDLSIVPNNIDMDSVRKGSIHAEDFDYDGDFFENCDEEKSSGRQQVASELEKINSALRGADKEWQGIKSALLSAEEAWKDVRAYLS